MPHLPRQTKVEITERVDIGQRVSVSLIALALALISLALGVAFLSNPGALLVVPSYQTASVPSTATAVTLEWTAPGDDADVGQATAYQIRYSTSPLTAVNFASASLVTNPPAPQPAGSTESWSVTNLQPSTTYFFALKTTDEAGNQSTISNITTKTTSALAQACIPQYVCSAWSVCANGLQTRSCTVTNGCPAGLDAPVTSQQCTVPPPPPDEPIPPPTSGGINTLRNPMLVAGVAGPIVPVIRVINPKTRTVVREFLAFARSNKYGVNVAVGDVTGDRQAEIVVGTGAGSDPLVKIFTDRGQLLVQFNPYPTSRGIGVSVATGDVDGNGTEEILTIPAKSASHVRIFRYRPTTRKVEVVAQTFAYDFRQRNGFSIAAGDLNLDGKDEFIVAARTNGMTVTALRMKSDKTIARISKFSPFGRVFETGLTLGIGDVNGDGRGDILVTPGPNYWSDVKAMTLGGKTLGHFLPASTSYRGGVDLATFDVNGDGREEVITATYRRGDPAVRVWRWDGLKKIFDKIQGYFVYPRTMQDGLRIEAAPHT